jgi:hypothetical protein
MRKLKGKKVPALASLSLSQSRSHPRGLRPGCRYRFPDGQWADGTAHGMALWHDPWATRHNSHRARAGMAQRPVQCMGRRPGP